MWSANDFPDGEMGVPGAVICSANDLPTGDCGVPGEAI
jgi:hypothetical protein